MKKGFTLIELLLVIAIISALAVAVFVALNPAKRIQDSNDARRSTDVDTILSAVHSYVVDNKGVWPTGLSATTAEVQLGTGNAAACSPLATSGCNVAASKACLDLGTVLAGYLKSVPIDPKLAAASDHTGYSVAIANGVVTVRACGTEGATNIYTSR